MSTSNVFIVKDGVVYTPPCKGGGNPDDTILEGVTRDSLLTLCKDKGYKVVEDKVREGGGREGGREEGERDRCVTASSHSVRTRAKGWWKTRYSRVPAHSNRAFDTASAFVSK